MAHFILLETTPGLKIYMSPLQIDPTEPVYPISTGGHAKQVASDLGRFHTLGMAEDTNALGDGILDEDQFLMTCDAIMRESEQLLWAELATAREGLFAFVFETTDRIQHMFWRFRDKRHPLYDPVLAERYGHVIEDYYRRADRIVGDVLNRLDPARDTLLIVSDHGFTSYRRSLHLNAWLIDNGYMTLVEGAHASDGLFHNVDWQKTKAFALGFSQIFLNIKGRDDKGSVAAADAPALRREIAERLGALVDPATGETPIEHVYDAETAFGGPAPQGPDLIVGVKQGYRFSWQTAVGGAPGRLFDDNVKRWSGDHCVDPQHVPGLIVSNRRLAVQDPSVLDVAPTVLSAFGLDRTPAMRGRDLFRETLSQRSQPREADL
jgi:predicted AlkP superfamily phosphohydrolase/phosphomutase